MHRDPRLSLTKVIVGVLSLMLLLLSAGTIMLTYRGNAAADQVATQSSTRTRQIASSGYDTATVPMVTNTSLPTPTVTVIPTPTSTASPTPTRAPSPKPTSTPPPKPTSTPPPLPVVTATPLPPATATPVAHATPGATASATPSTGQNGGLSSTPTSSSTGTNTSRDNNGLSTSPNGQGSSLPVLELFGGVLCFIAFLFLLFIGWRQLRKHLMPATLVKLPPSGAPPWSRERADNLSKQVNNNQGFIPPGPAIAGAYRPATSPIIPHQGNSNNGLLPPTLPVTNGPWNANPTNASPVTNGPRNARPTNAPRGENYHYLLEEKLRRYREKGSAS